MHVSSHRLFFVNSHQPISQSFSLDLTHITRTDHYAGLFMSSSKATLYLDSTFVPPSGYQDGVNGSFESWICDVCNHRNPPGLSPAAARMCALCGVPRSALSGSPQPNSSTLPPLQRAASLSLPATFLTLHASSAPPSIRGPSPIACTACTFLNHPSLHNCEVCSTPLLLAPGNAGINSKSAPSSRPVSPLMEDNVLDPANPLIKLSFRRGGDRTFYTTLRRALKARVWEVSPGMWFKGSIAEVTSRGDKLAKGIRAALRVGPSLLKGARHQDPCDEQALVNRLAFFHRGDVEGAYQIASCATSRRRRRTRKHNCRTHSKTLRL